MAVRAYDWDAWHALALQKTHASRLAQLCHPNLLPLVGVCAESRQFAYDLMPVSADALAWIHQNALALRQSRCHLICVRHINPVQFAQRCWLDGASFSWK